MIDEEVFVEDTLYDQDKLTIEEYWLGDYSLEDIYSGIDSQFDSYDNLEDTTDYVSIFFNQLDTSVINTYGKVVELDVRSVLSGVGIDFIMYLVNKFYEYFTISFREYEGIESDTNKLINILKSAYNFFILNARKNFITVISSYIADKEEDIGMLEGNEYFNKVDNYLQGFTPLVECVDCVEFAKATNDESFITNYESGEIIGNYFRKFSPHLDEDNDIKDDIYSKVNEISMLGKDE